MNYYPPGIDRYEAPPEESVERFVRHEKWMRFSASVFLAGTVAVCATYVASVCLRVLLLFLYLGEPPDWVTFFFAEFMAPGFYIAAFFAVVTVAFWSLFLTHFSPVTLNLSAYTSLSKAIVAHQDEMFVGMATLTAGTVSFFVTASLTVDPCWSFENRWRETKFILGFLTLMVMKFVWDAFLSDLIALKFPANCQENPDLENGGENNALRRWYELVCVLELKPAAKDVLDHLLIYLVVVSFFSGLFVMKAAGFYAGIVDFFGFFVSVKMIIKTFCFALIYSWFHLTLRNIFAAVFTGPLEFGISSPASFCSSDLKLDQAIHPALTPWHMWLRYVAAADLRYLAKHSASRRAVVFEPAINGQAFDKLCTAVLANLDKEAAKWEGHEQGNTTAKLPTEAKPTVPSFKSPWAVETQVPEGLRPRATFAKRYESGQTLISPVASSTPVRILTSPSMPDYAAGVGQEYGAEQTPSPPCHLLKVVPRMLTQKLLNAVMKRISSWAYVQHFTAERGDVKAAQKAVEAPPIIWALEGLSLLVVAARTEDAKGLVWYHVTKIVSSILRLRKALCDAQAVSTSPFLRNKMPGLCQPSMESRVRSSLLNATNEALLLLSKAYGKDLRSLRLNEEQQAALEQFQSTVA